MLNCVMAMVLAASFLAGPVKPIDNCNTKEKVKYTDEGTKAKVISEYTSPDGLCNIKYNGLYYDVTLYEEEASPYDVGIAYGKAINEIYPEYVSSMEPYLWENIRCAFPFATNEFTGVEKRVRALYDTLDIKYKREIDGLTTGLGVKARGLKPDGVLSIEEVMVAQMIPDCLRQGACSGLSLWGSKTDTGDMLAVRCLEWRFGKDNSMCKAHSVLHIKEGDRSITSIGFLGLLDVISGVNDKGLFAAIIDVGTDRKYSDKGKICYSFETRHILETFDNAKDAGNYMVDNSDSYTYSHNIMLTDGKESYCAEDACAQAKEEGNAYSILRDNKTPLMKDIKWESPDSLCIVNSYVSKGNFDLMTGNKSNAVRFAKYNKWVKETKSFNMAKLKETMTQESVDANGFASNVVQNVHRDDMAQMILLDYHNGNVQAAFTGVEGVVDKPVFYEVEKIPVSQNNN